MNKIILKLNFTIKTSNYKLIKILETKDDFNHKLNKYLNNIIKWMFK